MGIFVNPPSAAEWENPKARIYVVGNMTRTTFDTDIEGVMRISPRNNTDDRGEFVELFNPHLLDLFPNGIQQVSQSVSKLNVLRGIHFQVNPPMGKLMQLIRGNAELALIDLRKKSPTYLKKLYFNDRAYGFSKDSMIYVPPGVGVAFRVHEDNTTIRYFHSSAHNPESSYTIRFDDPDLKLFHGEFFPIMSKKDWRAMSFHEWNKMPESDLL